MRKINGFCVVLVIVFALAVIFTGSTSAQTQTTVCPAGLICIPKNQVVTDCPAGLVCVPDPVYTKPIVNTLANTVSTAACYKFSSEMGYKGIYESVSMGTEVANLQNLLISKGFDIPSITTANTPAGSFDEDTRNAVMKYQSSKRIRATGYVGPLTMASLNTLCLSDNPGSSRIKVLNPNGGEVLKEGSQFTIKWSSNNLPTNSKILVDIYNSSDADIKYPNNQIAYLLPSTQTTYSWIVTGNNGWGIGKSSIYQKVANLFGVKNANALNNQYVISVRAFDPVTYKTYSYDQSDSTFTIISGESPSPSPSGNSSSPIIYSISPSKGGLNTPIVLEGANFSAVTSLDLYASSGKWMGTLVPSQVSSNRITFSFSKAFAANTGSDTYQLSAVSSNCKAGCNSNRVSYTLDNSASTPTPTISPVQTPNQPRVSFTYPVGSETWMVGDTKTVSWSYANFDSNVSGDKWVDLMLQPMDGREAVKLATYTAPYTSTPLKIYIKTTDGRNAWLPGQYKLKLVCRSTNIEGFRSCAEAMPGYITIVQPSPTPTPTSEATIMQNTTGADLNASIWSAVEEYLRNR